MRSIQRTAIIATAVACVAAAAAAFANAVNAPPSPGVVAGGFCTYGTGFLKTSLEASQRLNQYLGTTNLPELHVGTSPNVYMWQKTGTKVSVGKGKKTVLVDSAVAALQEAIGTAGRPGALSMSATNPTDMGTGGILAAQALALKINQSFSELFVTPATGFSGLSLVNMEGVQLDGSQLTPTQASALNGRATLQVREAADVALGGGPLPYGLSAGQLTDLIDVLNGSFESCGQPSSFAQEHLYQPYVTSNVFAGRRPSTVSTFAYKPTYNTFSGDVVPVSPSTGCDASAYASFPPGKIALIERGGCTFYQKVHVANTAGARATIIFNSTPETGPPCPPVPTPGSGRCEALVGMGAAAGSAELPIPAAFVQRSTGLALRDGTAVTAFVQQ